MFGMPELKMEGIQVKDMGHLNSIVKDNKPKMILVYAPWCGHCQSLKPIWNSFVKNGNEKHCYAVSDSVMGNSRNIGDFQVEGFPTIVINKKDGTLEQYNGERTEEGFQTALGGENDNMFGGKRKSKRSHVTKKRKSNKHKLKKRKSGKKSHKSKRKTKKH